MKELRLSHILLRSQMIEYLAGLRELRHENVNTFMGCCMTTDSFNLLFEYCHWGCLQVITQLFVFQDESIYVTVFFCNLS